MLQVLNRRGRHQCSLHDEIKSYHKALLHHQIMKGEIDSRFIDENG